MDNGQKWKCSEQAWASQCPVLPVKLRLGTGSHKPSPGQASASRHKPQEAGPDAPSVRFPTLCGLLKEWVFPETEEYMKKITCPHWRTSAGHLRIKNHKIKLTFTNAFNFCILAEGLLAHTRCLFMNVTRKWQFGNMCRHFSCLTQFLLFINQKEKR